MGLFQSLGIVALLIVMSSNRARYGIMASPPIIRILPGTPLGRIDFFLPIGAGRFLTFLFSSKVLCARTPSGHNDPVFWDVDNCDKKTRNIFFTCLLHEIELVNTMSDD